MSRTKERPRPYKRARQREEDVIVIVEDEEDELERRRRSHRLESDLTVVRPFRRVPPLRSRRSSDIISVQTANPIPVPRLAFVAANSTTNVPTRTGDVRYYENVPVALIQPIPRAIARPRASSNARSSRASSPASSIASSAHVHAFEDILDETSSSSSSSSLDLGRDTDDEYW